MMQEQGRLSFLVLMEIRLLLMLIFSKPKRYLVLNFLSNTRFL